MLLNVVQSCSILFEVVQCCAMLFKVAQCCLKLRMLLSVVVMFTQASCRRTSPRTGSTTSLAPRLFKSKLEGRHHGEAGVGGQGLDARGESEAVRGRDQRTQTQGTHWIFLYIVTRIGIWLIYSRPISLLRLIYSMIVILKYLLNHREIFALMPNASV